jgi:hypothetical protein
MEVDYKFLNFGINIEKALKLHGLKMYFSLKILVFELKNVVNFGGKL